MAVDRKGDDRDFDLLKPLEERCLEVNEEELILLGWPSLNLSGK
jgi:hypothetical protein